MGYFWACLSSYYPLWKNFKIKPLTARDSDRVSCINKWFQLAQINDQIQLLHVSLIQLPPPKYVEPFFLFNQGRNLEVSQLTCVLALTPYRIYPRFGKWANAVLSIRLHILIKWNETTQCYLLQLKESPLMAVNSIWTMFQAEIWTLSLYRLQRPRLKGLTAATIRFI